MPEGMQDPSTPNRRGRRNPELLAEVQQPEMDMDDGALNDAGGDQSPEEMPLLYPGDIMLAKASITMDVAGQEAWFTYGVQTRVQPHESEEDAFMRVGATITTRVLDLASAAEVEIEEEIRRQREAARRRPIAPQQNR